ncbi:MAG: hypothetical protein IPG51_11320 [Chloroflexi bacterium]|nr:hypothetical protein [Chloroflexota bacterium]
MALEPYAPFVDPQQFSATGFDYLYLHTAEWYAENGFEYLVFAQGVTAVSSARQTVMGAR